MKRLREIFPIQGVKRSFPEILFVSRIFVSDTGPEPSRGHPRAGKERVQVPVSRAQHLWQGEDALPDLHLLLDKQRGSSH